MFEKSFKFICELLLNPNITNNGFDLEDLSQTKKTLIIVCVVVVLGVIAIVIYNRKRIIQSTRGLMNKSYFTISELCASDTADKHNIANTPTAAESAKLQLLIDNLLDPLRRAYGSWIAVNSGFRSAALNAKIGGASSSQHTKAEAVDIDGGSVENNRKIFAEIVKLGTYDQLIWEKGGQWVHVSYKHNGLNRREMLNYANNSYTRINTNWQQVISA